MTKLDITNSSYIRLILILLGLGFLFLVRDVLVLLFVTLIIVAGLSPTVNRWAKYLSRPGAVVLVFLIIFAVLGLIFRVLIPPLTSQIQAFGVHLPQIANTLNRTAHSNGTLAQISKVVVDNLNSVSGQLSNFGETIFSHTLGVVSGVVAIITIFVLSFYLLIEQDGLKKVYRGVLAPEYYERLAETTKKIAEKLGAWLRGQIFLMVVIGVFVTIGLAVMGIPFALALGLWAAITEIVPIIGPWIGAIPGVIVGLSISPLYGLLAAILYLVVQQLESNFLVPKVMSRAVGLNPVVVIIAILIGDKLYGLTGVLLSVPLAAAISVIAADWSAIRRTFDRNSS